MRRIVTDRGAWSVMIVSLAEMAEPLEVLFGMWTWVGPRNPVLDWHAHWRHLANRVKLSVCDVALRQITLGPRNRVLDEVQILPWEGAILGERVASKV